MKHLLVFIVGTLGLPALAMEKVAQTDPVIISSPVYDELWDNYVISARTAHAEAGSICYSQNCMLPTNWTIDSFFVEKQYRKKGTGFLLFEKCLKDIKTRAGKLVEWEVAPTDDGTTQHDLLESYKRFIQKFDRNLPISTKENDYRIGGKKLHAVHLEHPVTGNQEK